MWETIILTTTLLLIFLVLRRLVDGKISARFQYALWIIVAVRLLFAWIPMPDSKISILPLFRAPVESLAQLAQDWTESTDGNIHGEITGGSGITQDSGGRRQVQNDGSLEQASAVGTETAGNPGVPNQKDAASPVETTTVQTDATLTQTLLGIYIVGACVLFLVIVLRNLFLLLRLKKLRIRYEGELPVDNVPGKVYLLEQAASPFLFGRDIYIAPEMLQNTKSLRYCLVHETCHFRQGDMFWAVIRNLCLVMYWYHPLVWLCVRLWDNDGELACDERVITLLGEEHRMEYGETLLAVIRKQAWGKSSISLSTQMSGSKRNVEKRIQRIARKKTSWISAAVFVIIGMAIALLFTLSDSGSNSAVPHNNADDSVQETVSSDWSVTETEGFPAMVVDENGNIVDFIRGNLIKKMYLSYIGEDMESPGNPMPYSIKENAFSNCVNLKTLIVSSAVANQSESRSEIKEIAENAFKGCPKDMVVYCEKDSYVWDYFKEKGFRVKEYDGEGDVTWESLGTKSEALKKVTDITSDSYDPADFANIKEELRQVYGEPYFVMTQSGKVLSQYHSGSLEPYSKAEVLFPKEATVLYATFAEDTLLTKTIKIPNHIVEIGDAAFQDCQIEQLEFEEGSKLEKIGEHAFRWCGFTDVTLPEGLKELGSNAFYTCDQLKEITIPSSVEKIGGRCFSLCNLETVTILNPDTEFPEDIQLEAVFDASIYSEEKDDMVPNTKLTIRCYKGSTAETYAKKLKLKVEYIK